VVTPADSITQNWQSVPLGAHSLKICCYFSKQFAVILLKSMISHFILTANESKHILLQNRSNLIH